MMSGSAELPKECKMSSFQASSVEQLNSVLDTLDSYISDSKSWNEPVLVELSEELFGRFDELDHELFAAEMKPGFLAGRVSAIKCALESLLLSF